LSNQLKKKKFLKLEYLRKKYGYSQDDMGAFLGYSGRNRRGTYSAKVNRRASFTFDEMFIILNKLNEKAKKAGDPELTLNDIFFD
jgi:hypothetical protein